MKENQEEDSIKHYQNIYKKLLYRYPIKNFILLFLSNSVHIFYTTFFK